MGTARNTIAYFKEQSQPLTAVVPTSVTDGYCSVELPDVTTGEKEQLSSELLSGSIGMRKPQLGFETASASVVTELRSHGDSSNPTEPDFGVFFKSAIGTPNTSTAEAVQAAPAPSTTEFGIATEGNIQKFDFMIIDNATDGRVARFCKELKLDVVAGVNDKIDFNEGGAELNASLTPGTYTHGGSTVVGSIGEHIKTQMELVGAGTITVTAVEESDGSYTYTIANSAGTFVLLHNTGTNAATSFLTKNLGYSGAADDSGAQSYESDAAIWGNRVVVNQAMSNAPTAADVVSASVNYKPINESHVKFTSGFYHYNSSVDGYLEQVIGSLVSSLGIEVPVGGLAKINVDIQGLKGDRTANTAAPHTPTYEEVQGFVGFCVEAYLGSTLIDASNLSLSVDNEIAEKQSFKECSGKLDSSLTQRTVSGTINPYADGSITNYDALNNLTDQEMSIVIGVMDSGGYVVGKTVGIYLPNVMLTTDKTAEIDQNGIEDISFQAHTGITGDQTDIVVSFA
jgi:hypothetical protein